MNYPHDQLATEDDACREYACNVGRERPEQAWILTDYDTWQANPFYAGPAVRHPEDDGFYEQCEAWEAADVEVDMDCPF